MENNKTYQFKKLTKEVLESLEDNRMYVLMGTNGHACSFSKGHIKHWINSYESVLLPASPLSKVGEVTDEMIKKESEKYSGDAMSSMAEDTWTPIGFIYGAKWMRSLLQPQPVNSEGNEEEFSKDEQISILKHKVKLLKKEILSVSSEGKKEEIEVKSGIVNCSECGKQKLAGTFCKNPATGKCEQGEAKEPTDDKEVENRFEKWLRERIGYKTTVPSEEVEIMRKAIIQCRSAYQSFRNKEMYIDFVFDKLKKHHKQLGIYLASENISHHDFGELSERILPNLYDTLSALFRSSEVKEQELTKEEIQKIVDENCPFDKTLNKQLEFVSIEHSVDHEVRHEKNKYYYKNGLEKGLSLRSLQVKSNEQTKTV